MENPIRPLKVVVISRCDPADLYIIDRVSRVFPDTEVLKPTWERPAGPGRPRLSTWARTPLGTAALGLRRAYYRREERRSNRRLRELLFPPPQSIPRIASERMPARDVNRDKGTAWLSSRNPDVMILSGAPILEPHVLAIPSATTLNVHFGISPAYRGEHSIFYALYNGDYEHVGVTIHHVDAGVDSGPAVARVYPSLAPADTETTLLAKCAVAAADVLVDFLTTGQSRLDEGRSQVGSGRLYRRADRRLWHDAHHALKRRFLRRLPPPRDGGTVRYYRSDQTRELSRGLGREETR